MTEPGPRVAAWLGTVSDLLREPLTEMPDAVIFDQLERTFAVTAVSHNRAGSDGLLEVVSHPHDALEPLAAAMEAWRRGEMLDCHALTNWHYVTGDPRPWTTGRVPTAIVAQHKRNRINQFLRPLALDQQLSLHYRLEGHSYSTYVLGRGVTDFSDDDLVVAGFVRRALVGLDRQVALLRRLLGDRSPSTQPVDLGLTGRELAVLGLLSQGHSTRLMAHRLGCSPRTVEKHLQRIYRKLGVRDRLNAVRTFSEARAPMNRAVEEGHTDDTSTQTSRR